MATIGPLTAALVGFFNLAVRQGWGLIVAVANGVWAGVLSIILSGVFYLLVQLFNGIFRGPINSADAVILMMQSEVKPLFDLVIDFPLLTLTIGVTAGLGFATELLHWLLVKMRKLRGEEDGPSDKSPSTRTTKSIDLGM